MKTLKNVYGLKSNQSIVALGVFLISAIFFLLACSKDKSVLEPEMLNFKSGQANPDYVKALNDFDFVGELHNEVLDFVFHKLAEVKAMENKQLSQVDLDFFLFGANSCKSFVVGSNKFPDVQTSLNFVDLEVNRFNSFLGDPMAQLSADNCYLEHTLSAYSNYFTPQQLVILRDIQGVFNDDEKDIAEILNDLNKFNDDVARSISDNKEALLVYSAISVGIHSLQYWNYNLENWINLFYDELPNKFWGSLWRAIRNIAAADLVGAAGAAGATAVANAIPGMAKWLLEVP